MPQQSLSTSQREFHFEELENADLIVDARYHGGSFGDSRDDPFPRLLGLSNMGGFRYRGQIDGELTLLMLLSTFSDPDWPDTINRETGTLTYFGDNKRPGGDLHETGKRGNRVLSRLFGDTYSGRHGRRKVPPTFVFARSGRGRAVDFLGLAVPGISEVSEGDDLVAIWKTAVDVRFQNYRAKFTILDAGRIPRIWIDSLIAGKEIKHKAPEAWKEWRQTGRRRRLISERTVEWRSKSEQFPKDFMERSLLTTITNFFSERHHGFENCALELSKMLMPNIESAEVTQPQRDGGRDAVGKFRIGVGQSSILTDFALEAKCFTPPTGVGVRYLSRLISRLRYRQFGILVTTTWLNQQAYQEIIEDGHPIIVISGSDIVRILKNSDLHDANVLQRWLENNFSPPAQNLSSKGLHP